MVSVKSAVVAASIFFTDELADITFAESFRIILEAFMDSIQVVFKPTEDQMEAFIELFLSRLPDYLRKSLAKGALVVY